MYQNAPKSTIKAITPRTTPIIIGVELVLDLLGVEVVLEPVSEDDSPPTLDTKFYKLIESSNEAYTDVNESRLRWLCSSPATLLTQFGSFATFDITTVCVLPLRLSFDQITFGVASDNDATPVLTTSIC